MNSKDEKRAQETALATNKQLLRESEAHMYFELKPLILNWLRFKLHIVFKKKDPGTRKSMTKSIYGNEHSVTYKQCLFGKVDHIVLSRLKGYKDLIQYIEKDLKGKYLACKIYYDPEGNGNFSVLCRRYYKGGLEEVNDPVITEEDVKTLFFSVEKNRLVIHETKPEEPDFKALVSEALE